MTQRYKELYEVTSYMFVRENYKKRIYSLDFMSTCVLITLIVFSDLNFIDLLNYILK